MSSLDDRDAYMKNDYWSEKDRIFSDYTTFYTAMSLCAIFVFFLAIVNIIFCYCSQHRQYWRDRHTGNRWISSLWTTTPHNNPPLDLTELETVGTLYQPHSDQVIQYHDEEQQALPQFIELQKRESDI